MANTNKKSSAKKKLIPAAAMLACSAVMLSAATYAWFTMSREVEVTGLKMTATVPEDLQISVGDITSGKNLNDTNSYLKTVGTAKPTEENMWSNTVNMSQYYSFGRLIPASSNDGSNIFFTPDATDLGRNIKQSAKYYQATDGLSESGSYMAALFAKNGETPHDGWAAPSGGTYSGAASWSVTNDDGYYIDVPVWIRTSSSEDVQITVDAYVKPGDEGTKSKASGAKVELYKATRVAILPTASSGNSGTAGVINMIDGSGTGWNGDRNVVDYYGTRAAHQTANGAVFKAGNANGSDDPENGSSGTFGMYKAATVYNSAGNNAAPIATIAGSNGSGYGDATMLWIRVWLEGEDPECWNQNAGQDWNISLKFEKVE